MKLPKSLKYALLTGFGIWLVLKGWMVLEALQEPPSAIVVLGGGMRREMQAAMLAQAYPDLPVLVSSGSTLPCLYRVFVQEKNVTWQRLTVDFRAVDTVTNFTALLPYLQFEKHRKVFLVVSSGQWQRAAVLGWSIWGSRGIVMEPVRVEGVGHDESLAKLFRDTVRAFAWIVLGDVTVDYLYHSRAHLDYQISLRHSRCEFGLADLPNNSNESRHPVK